MAAMTEKNVKKKYNFDNLPDSDVLKKTITEIRNCDKRQVSYQKFFYKIINEIKAIPFVTAKLKKGYHIERVRINKPDEIFYSENEISYRTDFENINEFGRANSPGKSLFYGAIKTEHIQHPRIINLFETSELFRNQNFQSGEFIMTIGKWRIKEDFEAIEMVFNKESIRNIPDVSASYNYYIEKFEKDFPEKINDIKLLLEFFSDEFAKKDIQSHHDYKISCAYTEIAIDLGNKSGVIYPSVRTNYEGTNVALSILAVEKFLKLEVVAMVKVYKKGKKSFMDNLAYAKDLGTMNENFKWVNIEGTPEEYINDMLLKQ